MLSKAKLNEKFSDTSLSDQLLQVHPGPHPRPHRPRPIIHTRVPGPHARGARAYSYPLAYIQVAKVITVRSMLQNERDVFAVNIGGFDTHSDVHEVLQEKFGEMEQALKSFVAEMKKQGIWGNVATTGDTAIRTQSHSTPPCSLRFRFVCVGGGGGGCRSLQASSPAQVTLLSVSDFGRTLTSNGAGTDHGWGGNNVVLGGAVRGKQILGAFPDDLTAVRRCSRRTFACGHCCATRAGASSYVVRVCVRACTCVRVRVCVGRHWPAGTRSRCVCDLSVAERCAQHRARAPHPDSALGGRVARHRAVDGRGRLADEGPVAQHGQLRGALPGPPPPPPPPPPPRPVLAVSTRVRHTAAGGIVTCALTWRPARAPGGHDAA